MEDRLVPYDYTVSKWFLLSTVLFGFIGMLIGVILAVEMVYPEANSFLGEYGTFGRLRPLHTNGVIFGFTLSGIFASWYYIGQRVLRVSYAESKFLTFTSKLHFYVYFLTLILGVVQLFLGVSTAKEYAELEWPIDILVVVFWVLWGVNIFGLLGLRREKVLYISIWYFIACFLGVAMLYLFNNVQIPTYFIAGTGSLMNSVSLYAGSNDAMVQWWYGHNAVGLVLTVPLLAMMYYFLPKESNRPVYSYKLSLIGFWSLIFVYLWAGGHHLIYSTVPDWVQTLGSIFSICLILPSWATSINIMLTMKGEWGQVKNSPIIKFIIFGSTFYMFSTLEGPVQAIKSVNALAHFTDWIIGHVHDGTLGFVAFVVMAACFHMAPRIFNRELYSKKLMETQFWMQIIAVVLYFSSMWVSGITQGMMWRATDAYGNLLYSFVDTLIAIKPYYTIRMVAGVLYLTGFVIFAYNLYKTMKSARRVEDGELINATPMAQGA